MPFTPMDHRGDPRKALAEKIGDISEVELFNNQVLVAVYIRPNKTASGIYLSDSTRDEDRFQGKVGLVLKMGPAAFVDPDNKWFVGANVKVGDWVVIRASDGWSLTINSKDGLCRMIDDIQIRAKIDHPDRVY